MNPLLALLGLSASEKLARGLVYTPKEIAQQPGTWLGTFNRLLPLLPEVTEFLTGSGLEAEGAHAPTVFLIGAGTSDYIGRSLYLLLREKWGCEVIPVPSPDLLTDFTSYVLPQHKYLWISFSRSGDSPEGVAVLERALDECPNVRHLVISCNAEGKMIRSMQGKSNALGIVLDEATNDHGLAMTSSYSNMVIAGQILAHAWSIEQYEPICRMLSQAADNFLPRAAKVAAKLAAEGYARACFVGSGVLAGAAMESALKLLELTAGKVQAFSQSTLALRHGPMAALDRNTLFVALVSTQEQRRKYEIDLLREIGDKALVRTRLAITTSDIEALNSEADYVLAPEHGFDIPDAYRPVLDIIFGQTLGLFSSLHCGLKPDTPSPNGAISRVVHNDGILKTADLSRDNKVLPLQMKKRRDGRERTAASAPNRI